MFNGYRVTVLNGENVLAIDSGDGCTMQMYLCIELAMVNSQMVTMVNFMFCIF